MAFTRFHDDPERIKKQLEQSTYNERYFLNMPGPGDNLPFMEDPYIRLEKWGANLHQNQIDINSDLRGMTRKLNRDYLDINSHKLNAVGSIQNIYSSAEPFVEETRASHPAWLLRGIEIPRWETPILNPQANLEKPFQHNVHSRIEQKDNFEASNPYRDYHH